MNGVFCSLLSDEYVVLRLIGLKGKGFNFIDFSVTIFGYAQFIYFLIAVFAFTTYSTYVYILYTIYMYIVGCTDSETPQHTYTNGIIMEVIPQYLVISHLTHRVYFFLKVATTKQLVRPKNYSDQYFGHSFNVCLNFRTNNFF